MGGFAIGVDTATMQWYIGCVRINGQAVREARRGQGISRAELAVEVGVSFSTIERIERNEGDCAAGTAYLVAQALNLRMDDLFTESVA